MQRRLRSAPKRADIGLSGILDGVVPPQSRAILRAGSCG
jgi:hypothetical protein